MKKTLILSSALALLLAACGGETKETGTPAPLPPDPLAVNRDTTRKPGDDFFYYANGGWFNAHPIPESENSNGIWRLIGDTINEQVKKICERSAADKSAAKGSAKQKIGDLYASGMDSTNVEVAGLKPLQAELELISAVKDPASLTKAISRMHEIGAGPALSVWVGQDDKISTKYAIFLGQGGLGLGDRDYYFNTDERTVNIRKEYLVHLKNIFQLSGKNETDAATAAETVMRMETDIAKVSRKLEDLRDPVKNYNKMTVASADGLAGDFDLKASLAALGMSNTDTVIVGQPEFFQGLSALIKKYPPALWQDYLTFHLIHAYAPYLSSGFDKENFRFYSTVLSGVKVQRPRWKRVVETTNESLGELIGQVYVSECVPKGTKEKLLEIGNNIREVFGEHIKKLDWMSEATKEKALKKLGTMVMKVGYPDKWKDMSALTIDRTSYAGNMLRVNEWHHHFNAQKLGKPVDRNEWSMYPQTYNAYYNPSNNEIVVPACNIVVPGFEGRMPDDAILYGIIGGSTFGHEITHGFDDQGSQYDEMGNLNNWWTPEDRKKFEAKTKMMVEQFNAFEVEGQHINGEATLGENIADLGGVVMGYEAFMKTEQFKKGEKTAGLTPVQRYFLAYAYAWMVNMRKEAILRRIMTDVHSPTQFRVNGPLANLETFYEAFGVKEGDAMWRAADQRIVIW